MIVPSGATAGVTSCTGAVRELHRRAGGPAGRDREPPQIEVAAVARRREHDRAAVARPHRVAVDRRAPSVSRTGVASARERRDPQARLVEAATAPRREHDPAAVRRDRRVDVAHDRRRRRHEQLELAIAVLVDRDQPRTARAALRRDDRDPLLRRGRCRGQRPGPAAGRERREQRRNADSAGEGSLALSRLLALRRDHPITLAHALGCRYGAGVGAASGAGASVFFAGGSVFDFFVRLDMFMSFARSFVSGVTPW